MSLTAEKLLKPVVVLLLWPQTRPPTGADCCRRPGHAQRRLRRVKAVEVELDVGRRLMLPFCR